MLAFCQRMARIAGLGIAEILIAGYLGGVEDQGSSAPGSILGGVEAFTPQRMGYPMLLASLKRVHNFGIQADSHPDSVLIFALASANFLERDHETLIAQGFVVLGSFKPAACFKASANIAGKSFPLLSARRRMPLQAVALKKYRCGTSPVSKISDNEHTAASLGHSEVLSVKKPVGEPIPEDSQEPEEGSKIPPSVRRQDAGDVLPDQPAGPIAASNCTEGKHEVATRIVQSLSESGDTEGLAGGSAAENIETCIRPLLKPGHVAPVRDRWVMMV